MTVIPRELRRDPDHKWIAGVVAGWSTYLDIDRNVLRFAYALVSVLTALVPGLLAYALMWALIPRASPAAK